MEIKQAAEKEMKRMNEVFHSLKIKKNSKQSGHFLDFAKNYFKDGIYFYEKGEYTESFEAFIISWAYLDCGLKLNFFEVPKNQKEWFTA